MGNRTAKFISALFASVLAGAPLSAVSQNAPSEPTAANTPAATDDCLASPKKTAPDGQHWYYRVERGTKRQCWYLRAEGTKGAQTAATSQKSDTPTPRSVQDARAEWPTPQGSTTQDTTASIPAPAAAASQPVVNQRPAASADANAEQPSLVTRWPDASAAVAPAPQQPTATAPKQADARPASKPTTAPVASASMAQAAADVPADKPTGSLQMLVLVVGGALALAGIIGSVIYRFAGSSVRLQAHDGTRRRVNWDNFEQPTDNARAPWAESAATAAPRPQRPQPLDFSFVPPQQTQQTHEAVLADDIQILNELDASPIEHDEPASQEPREPDVAPSEARADETDARDNVKEAEADDAVDIDVITQILERLAKEGPRLSEPNPESRPEPRLEPSLAAGSGEFARSRRAQRAARA